MRIVDTGLVCQRCGVDVRIEARRLDVFLPCSARGVALRKSDCGLQHCFGLGGFASIIEFLLTRDAGYITGQAIHVNGGMTL